MEENGEKMRRDRHLPATAAAGLSSSLRRPKNLRPPIGFEPASIWFDCLGSPVHAIGCALPALYRVLPGFTLFLFCCKGFHWVSSGFTGFYWVLLGFTGFYQVSLFFYEVKLCFIGFFWVLLGLTGFNWVLMGFIGFYWVLLGFSEFYRVSLCFFTRLNWVSLGFTGFYCFFWVLPDFTLFLRGLTGSHWVLLGFTGFYFGLTALDRPFTRLAGFGGAFPGFTGFCRVLMVFLTRFI